MSQDLDGYTQRVRLLRQIVQLKESIAEKQCELARARSALESARRQESERQRTLAAIDDHLRATAQEVHRKSAALYLDGESQSRGMLTLDSEVIRFSGWHGHFEIPLERIDDIQVGTLKVPPRAGIPILSKFIPGEVRQCRALLLTLRGDERSAPRTVLIADLPDAARWRDHIRDQQERYRLDSTARAELIERRRNEESLLAQARHLRKKNQDRVAALEAELTALRAELKTAERTRSKSPHPEMDAALEDLLRTEREALKRLGGS